MQKYKITADSTCDLSVDLLKKYDISIIGLNILLGGKEYIDRDNITPQEIYSNYEKSKILPKTAARNSEEYKDLFLPYVEKGMEVIHFSLSSEISSSYQNALQAANEINQNGKKVWVINTKLLSSGSGLLAIKLHEFLQGGMRLDKAVKEVESIIPKVQLSFCVDTLEYLYKGGRCSSLVMLGGSVLKIHPCIKMTNGSLAVCGKFKGSMEKVAKSYIKMLKEKNTPNKSVCFVTHADCEEKQISLVCETLKTEMGFEEIIIQNLGCTIASHCGKGTLGILFINE